jgi:hypothetical protein
MATIPRTIAALGLDPVRFTTAAWSIDGSGTGETHVLVRGGDTVLCGADMPLPSRRRAWTQSSIVLSGTRPVTCPDCIEDAADLD